LILTHQKAGAISAGFFVGARCFLIVMPGLVPGIHVFAAQKNVDGRDEPGHDD
jgi:hypothetical protein